MSVSLTSSGPMFTNTNESGVAPKQEPHQPASAKSTDANATLNDQESMPDSPNGQHATVADDSQPASSTPNPVPLEMLWTLDRLAEIGRAVKDKVTTESADAEMLDTSNAPEANEAPGHLSPDGPRHDNDHADISQISIMPTTAEIYATRPEYLPVAEPSLWHKQGSAGLIDRRFRLLREDTVGLIRDSVRIYRGISNQSTRHLNREGEFTVRANVNIHRTLGFDPSGGLLFYVAFRQSPDVLDKMPDKREEYWMSREGTLVCLMDDVEGFVFCTVGAYGKLSSEDYNYSADRARIPLRPVVPSERHTGILLGWSNINGRDRNYTMLEFPNFKTCACIPQLQALQKMNNLPLCDLVVPSTLPGAPSVFPPAYSMQAGFRFDLSKVMQEQGGALLDVSAPFDVNRLEAYSNLDGGQSRALVHALTHRMALIQGPPGTGKSYTGVAVVQTLLDSLPDDTSGPIICVSFKNEALDSLLEKLHEVGVDKIIRVGNFSKSTLLAEMTLAKRSKDMKRPRELHTKMNKLAHALQSTREKIPELLRDLPTADYERERLLAAVTNLISSWSEKQAAYDEGWEEHRLNVLKSARVIGVTAGSLCHHRALFEKLAAKVMVFEEAAAMPEANALIALLPSLEHCVLIGDHLQLRPKVNRRELDMSNEVSMKYAYDMSLMERLVSSGLPFAALDTQYRMSPEVSRLCRRTLYPGLQDAAHVQLYPTVPGLRERIFWFDHEEPEAIEEVAGSNKSNKNDFEAAMIVGLVKHFLAQDGIQPHEIAVISMYAAQSCLLQQMLQQLFPVQALPDQGEIGDEEQSATRQRKSRLPGAIVVDTVDSFQGEEARIVILSLVRSNPQNNAGFLKTVNRANVSLTRAKHGMFIFGNRKTFQTLPFWNHVTSILEETSSIGRALQIECSRHPDKHIQVCHPEDFSLLCSDIHLPCLEAECAAGLEAGTTKFVFNARHQHASFMERALREMDYLSATVASVGQEVSEPLCASATIGSDINGKTPIQTIKRLVGRSRRYENAINLRADLIKQLHSKVKGERALQTAWNALPTPQHPRPHLQEELLVLHLATRLELAVVSDLLTIRSRAGASRGSLALDFSACRARCAHLSAAATARLLPRLAAEADVLWVQWAVLERRAPSSGGIAAVEALRSEARTRLGRAERSGALDVVAPALGLGLQEEIVAAESALADEAARWGPEMGVVADGEVLHNNQ
ncbi:Nf-x1 finger and helicase domain containing protein [Neofusicoccum parvum]|nr:Nf-x1 finger and helicase domain containing protein [Neofusicoccum parvum]